MKKTERWKIVLALALVVIFGYAAARFVAGIPEGNGSSYLPEASVPGNPGINAGSLVGGGAADPAVTQYEDLVQLWEMELGGLNFVTWGDDRLLVASTTGRVMALDSLTGEILWSFNVGDWIASRPTYADGMVYFGSVDKHVYALDAATGALAWSFRAEGEVLSPPLVADGMVFFISDNNLVYDLKTRVYALEARDGRPAWTYDVDGWISASPACDDGGVYLGTYSREGICLEAGTGQRRWAATLSSLVFTSPAAGEGVVYLSCIDGTIYALNAP